MIKIILKDIKEIDKNIISFMFKGFKFSFVFMLFSSYILALYYTYPFSHISFEAGILLFKASLMCFTSFFICAFFINKICNL